MQSSLWALAGATFVAAVVEMVEALTIVMAMGMTRSWRSTLAGVAAALVALTAFTAATGYALATWLPRTALQLTIGTLLLIFGLQWLRKAILRSAGRKSLHDEDAIYAQKVAAARAAGQDVRLGMDWFSFVVSFKGVFLEGVEVVFIVITFGLNAHNVPVAAVAAGVGAVLVLAIGIMVRGPLSKVPENTLKYAVGLLLATFGTYWAMEGLGALRAGREPLDWPGADLSLLGLLIGWYLLSLLMVRYFRVPAEPTRGPATKPLTASHEVA